MVTLEQRPLPPSPFLRERAGERVPQSRVSPRPLTARVLHAAFKAIAAKIRAWGALPTHPQWTARAEACERCPLRVIENKISYCGRPFLDQIDRDPTRHGCGCPTRLKAKDPSEHCPLTNRFVAAETTQQGCNCKWCSL